MELTPPSAWNQPPSRIERSLQPGERWTDTLQLIAPPSVQNGMFNARLRTFADGQVVDEYTIRTKVDAPVRVVIEPLHQPLQQAPQLQVTVQNLLDAPFEGTLGLRDSSGRLLTALQDAQVKLAGRGSQTIAFDSAAASVPATPFHEYTYAATVTRPDGSIAYTKTIPLDLLITRIATASVAINGDLSDWANAYPAHLRFGEETVPADSLAVTVFTMIDGEKFYIAVRVRDDMHNQEFTQGAIWRGDSIQFSLDPLLQRNEGGYGPHDMELGLALPTKGGEPMKVVYVSENRSVLDRAQAAVSRDDEAELTIYEIAIPLADLPKLPTAPGKRFGFNIAVHDADRAFSRERLLEFTPGTSGKNPFAYKAWVIRAQ